MSHIDTWVVSHRISLNPDHQNQPQHLGSISNSPVVESLNKGLMSVPLKPSANNWGEPNSPVVESLNKDF
eukprot:1194504-Prorocentrum_minimum.AAC.2